MRLNLFKALHNEDIALLDFQNALHNDKKNLIKKMEGIEEFNKEEIEIIHEFLPNYDLNWLLEIVKKDNYI